MSKLYFLCILIFIEIKTDIINNPLHLDNRQYPFLLSISDNDYNYLITSGKSFQINTTNGLINETKNTISFPPNSILIKDKSNNNYLYDSNNFYKIDYKDFISFNPIPKGSEITNPSSSIIIIGSIAKENNFIIYGLSDNKLFFSNNFEKIFVSEKLFNPKLSCKFIEEEEFICAKIEEDKIKIILLNFNIKEEKYFDIFHVEEINFEIFIDLALYDTSKNNIKYLCGYNGESVDCLFLECGHPSEPYIKFFLEQKINFNYNFFSQINCYFSEFNSEYLFCCGFENLIKCVILDFNNYKLIKKFKLSIEGLASYLTIKSYSDKAIIFYMSTKDSENKIYEYYIFKPICKNLEVPIFYRLNSNRIKSIKISELFFIRTNKYYFKIENPPEEIGYFKIPENSLDPSVDRILIGNNDMILEFLIKEGAQINDRIISINYNVSVEDEDIYLETCQIELKFSKCYSSCKDCLDSEFNETNHSCIKCITGYYFLEHTKNCYDKSFTEKGYYLDDNNIQEGVEPIFKKCYKSCKTCTKYIMINPETQEEKHNCIVCAENYYNLINDLYPTNCYDIETIKSFEMSKNSINTWSSTDNEKIERKKESSFINIRGSTYSKLSLEDEKKNPESNCLEEIEVNSNNEDYKELKDNIEEEYKETEINFGFENYKEEKYSLYMENEFEIEESLNTRNSFETNHYLEIEKYEANENIYSEEFFEENESLDLEENKDKGETIYIKSSKENIINSEKEDSEEIENTSESEDSIEIKESLKEERTIKKIEIPLIINPPEIILKTHKFHENKNIEENENSSEIKETLEKESYEYIEDSDESKYILEEEYSLENKNIEEQAEISTETRDSVEKEKESDNYFEDLIEYENIEEIRYSTFKKENINTNKLLNCDEACLDCFKESEINNTNCLNCNIEKGYYPKYGDNSNCFNNKTISLGYFLDKKENSYTWKKCYDKCESCFAQGNDINMNCLSCKNNLLNNKQFFYEVSKGNCIEKCSNNRFITTDEQCLSKCPNQTFKFYLNHSCLSSCPNGYEENLLDNDCILKAFDQTTTLSEFKNQILNNISSFVNSSKVINGSNFLAVVLSSDNMNPEEQLKNGISAIDLGNCTEVLKEYYNISKEDNLIILNMESKNKECHNNNDDNSFNLGKNIQLEVFDSLGRKLDLSICNEDIKVMKYIGDVKEIDIKSAMDLANCGIDVFNAADDFFNDICHPFENPDRKDIIINDRRNEIYQNATFCQEGCSYTGMSYDLMAANCICDSRFLQTDEKNKTENEETKISESVNFKSITKSFTSNLLDFNFEVIYCYNLVFNIKILINNIGFYCLASMLTLQSIFLFLYLVKKLQPLKNFMIHFKKINQNNNNNNLINIDDNNVKNINKSNPIPKINNNSIITSLNDNEISNKQNKNIKRKLNNQKQKVKLKIKDKVEENHKNLKNFSKNLEQPNPFKLPEASKNKKKLEKNFIISQNFNPTINIQSPLVNIDNNKNIITKNKKRINLMDNSEREEINAKIKNNELKLENKDNIITIQKVKIKRKKLKKKRKNIFNNIQDMETISGKKEDINTSKISNSDNIKFSDSEIQDMDYEEAIIYDKRRYFKIYWAFLLDSQIILGTFCTDNNLNLFIIKLSFFVCTFQISFFLNALFYTDEYISDAYHNDGVLDFFSGLPKSIYSFIATLITTNLLKMLSNSQSELMKVIRERYKFKNYIKIIEMKLSKLRKKLIIYFILIFLLGTFFLYYVSSFCALYKH